MRRTVRRVHGLAERSVGAEEGAPHLPRWRAYCAQEAHGVPYGGIAKSVKRLAKRSKGYVRAWGQRHALWALQEHAGRTAARDGRARVDAA
eukprot:11212725-Lingulodinium_polyedra.AAC.1